VDSATGRLLPWNPNVGDRTVHAMAVADGRVHLGFDSVPHLMAVDAASGSLVFWTKSVSSHGAVWSLHPTGDRLYVAGWYDSIGTVRCHSGLVALNPETGALVQSYPDLYRQHQGLTAIDGKLFMGGYGMASIDLPTGEVRPWARSNIPGVIAQASQGGRVYSGGDFTMAGQEPRERLAAFDASSGAIAPWNPRVDAGVRAMAAASGTVYVGGSFTTVAGAPHSFLAAIDDPDVLDVPNQRSAGPWAFELHPVHPNPLSSSSIARVRLDRPARVTLDLVDVTGRRMRTVLSSRELPAGEHRWALDRGSLAAGIYWLRLVVDGDRAAQRIVVLR